MRRLPPVLSFVALGAGLFVVAMALDGMAAQALADPDASRRDWHRMLRVWGYLPYWLPLPIAWRLIDRGPGWRRVAAIGGGALEVPRAAFLTLSVFAGGIASEVLKMTLRRLRPGDGPGYEFRPWAEDTFSSSGLGLPSGHTSIAFSGAFALCALWPRAAPVWLGMAAGCGLTRVIDGAHWLSDAALGAAVGYAAAWAARRWTGRSPADAA